MLLTSLNNNKKNNNGVAVALLRLCVQYVWNKKGKLFSQAVLCFIIGLIDPWLPCCTELAGGAVRNVLGSAVLVAVAED